MIYRKTILKDQFGYILLSKYYRLLNKPCFYNKPRKLKLLALHRSHISKMLERHYCNEVYEMQVILSNNSFNFLIWYKN